MNIVSKIIVPAVLGLSMLPLSAATANTTVTSSSAQAIQMNQLAYYGCHRRCFTVRRCWRGYYGHLHCRFVPVCRSYCRHWR